MENGENLAGKMENSAENLCTGQLKCVECNGVNRIGVSRFVLQLQPVKVVIFN